MTTTQPIDSVRRAIADAMRPDPKVLVDEWAEDNRVLPPDTPEPGPYRNARTPYLIDIQRTMSPGSPWREGWWMKPHQVGGSVSGENMIGAWVSTAAGSMLVVFPTLEAAKQWELSRFEPMRQNTRALRRRIKAADKKGSDNTKLRKRYPGGVMRLIGANRAASAKSATIRYVKFEECDEYPQDVEGQGSLIKLVIGRTSNFGRRAKIFGDSTPTIAGQSMIEQQVERGDKRKWHLHCPDCQHPQVLRWEQLKYIDSSPETARYECEACGVLETEANWKRGNYRPRPRGMTEEQAKASGRAYWEPTAVGEPGVASWCDFGALNAPVGWRPWPELVQEWLTAQQALQAGDDGPLITFTNNMLGRCYELKVRSSVGAELLQQRAERYELMTAPRGVLAITAGVDTQDNRLAVVIRGWGRGEESWGIWHGEIYGDPSLPDVWKKLRELLDTPVRHESGQSMRIDAVAIDSGGHHREDVYAFARDAQLRGKHWFAIKGASSYDAPKLGRPKTQEFTWRGQPVLGGAELRQIGTQAIKTLIDGRLKLGVPGGGYYHFPLGFGADYYKQMRSERRIWKRDSRGVKRLLWDETSQRNESWDCEVYAYAALLYAMSGRHAETVWAAREQIYGTQTQPGLDFAGSPVGVSAAAAPVRVAPVAEPPRAEVEAVKAPDGPDPPPVVDALVADEPPADVLVQQIAARRAANVTRMRRPGRGGFVQGWR
jgi:phage terminase large subunit GpA-like protein